jgi:hypothetical protein
MPFLEHLFSITTSSPHFSDRMSLPQTHTKVDIQEGSHCTNVDDKEQKRLKDVAKPPKSEILLQIDIGIKGHT